jgi:hypothetical protein
VSDKARRLGGLEELGATLFYLAPSAARFLDLVAVSEKADHCGNSCSRRELLVRCNTFGCLPPTVPFALHLPCICLAVVRTPPHRIKKRQLPLDTPEAFSNLIITHYSFSSFFPRYLSGIGRTVDLNKVIMSVFGGGIVWDPREPLPLEYVRSGHPPPQNRGTKRCIDGLEGTVNVAYNTHIHGWRSERPVMPQAPGQRPEKLVASYTVQEPQRNILPPWSITIDASVLHAIASFKVTQIFWNDSQSIIPQGAFTFPLPNGCAVTAFSCRIGTAKALNGVVKPKKQAREEFDRQKAAGRTVGLMEENTSEIFTTELGNIPADTKVKVELSFVTSLKRHLTEDDNEATTSLTIPTSIAARYGSPNFTILSSPTDVPEGLKLTIEVHGIEPTTSVRSKTHEIAVHETEGARKAPDWTSLVNGSDDEDSDRTLLVTLNSDKSFFQRDFVLDIGTRVLQEPRAWLEPHPSYEHRKTLMVTLPPRFFLQPRPHSSLSEVLFLIDRSGSMADKMSSVKSAMQLLLKGIPQGRKFNIWSFGDSHTSLWTESTMYSEGSLDIALSYVSNSLRADMGGTEILPALVAMIAARDYACETDIIVLTDGQVWRLDDTLEFVQKTRESLGNDVRFFSLGIGDAASHALVEGIADVGGGYCEMVPSSMLENIWQSALVSLTKAALMTCNASHTEMYLGGEGASTKSKVDMSSMSPSSYQRGKPNGFACQRCFLSVETSTRNEAPSSLVIETFYLDGTKHRADVQITPVKPKRPMLHSVAARSRLDDLERDLRRLRYKHGGQPVLIKEGEQAIRTEAEKTAQQESLMSRWTSFFLVDESGWSIEAYDICVGQPLALLNPGPRMAGGRGWGSPSGSSSLSGCLTESFGGELCSFSGRYAHGDSWGGSNTPVSPYPSFTPTRYSDAPHSLTYSDAPQFFMSSAAPQFVTYSESPEPPSMAPHRGIENIIRFQKYDGSFDFLDLASVWQTVGQELATILHDLINEGFSSQIIYTTAMIVLLEREFPDCKDMWDLNHLKATIYLDSCADKFPKEEMESRLRGIPFEPSSPQATNTLDDDDAGTDQSTSSRADERKVDASTRSQDKRNEEPSAWRSNIQKAAISQVPDTVE